MGRPKKGVTFWNRVESQTERRGECDIFTGCLDDSGYGRINKDGKLVRVHRAVWERANGPIPSRLYICHTCDNPSCIRLEHLWAGSQKENMQDCARKGRQPGVPGNTHTKDSHINVGSAHGCSKLTEKDVLEIRSLDGPITLEMAAAIGEKYGISCGIVYRVRSRRSWKHVK